MLEFYIFTIKDLKRAIETFMNFVHRVSNSFGCYYELTV